MDGASSKGLRPAGTIPVTSDTGITTDRTELIQALIREDRTIQARLVEQAEARRVIEEWLGPATELRRQERDALARKIRDFDGKQQEDAQRAERVWRLESALADARGEVEALRQSRSWKVTRPLRAVYRWLSRFERADD